MADPRMRAVLPLVLSIFLAGCVHIAPIRISGEKGEAMALARILKQLAPQAQALLLEEHNCANGLKVTLDESGQVDPATFRTKFNSYIDRLIAVRDKRVNIQETLRQGVWQSPMVHVIRHDAVVALQEEIARNQTWIELAQNVRLRSDLGRVKDFPELPQLKHQLDGFLSQPEEAPLANQLHALEEEFRFGEAEVGT